MQVLSRCPLEVGSILWLPRPSAYTLTVVAKATFRLSPEVSQLAEEQDPVIEADSYWDHDEAKSLDSATDLVPRKRYPEVILVGHAYAPKGVAVGGLQARLTVCEIDKAIDISGDRHFKLDGTLSHPGRFAKMPLRWERAAGGPDTSNPVGVVMGEEARADGWGRVHLPNLVPSGRIIASREDIVAPACFAPVAPSWPSRVTRLHRHAASFSPQGWFARPLPPDLDLGYFNAAPQDQYLRELLGTERFTLENLHPHYPLLTTRLASVGPRAVVDWGGGSTHEVPFTCDTLLIDTDRFVATLTFRAQVPLDYPERQGWVIVTSDAFPEVEVPSWIHDVQNPNETMAQPSHALAAMAALPFDAKQTGPQPAFERAPTAQPFDPKQTGPQAAWRPGRGALPFDVKTGPQPAFEAPPALPFGGAARGSHASLPEAVPFGDALRSSHASLPDAVPFVEPDEEEPSFVADPDEPPFDEEETFASVRGDAPFPVGTKAAPVASVTSAGAAPFVPPKVPQGPRLGAFRLVTKSDAPPPAGLDFTDAPTDEPGAADIDDRSAGRAPGIPTPPPMVTPQRPPMASQPDVEPPPMVRRAGTMPLPDRTSDPGLPFGKGPPGKVLPGVMPPGKIAPMKPGVPPPPPSAAGRSEPPTFGFRGASAGGRSLDASRDSAPDSTPFTRAQTLPTPGLYPAPAMPFGPPDDAAPAPPPAVSQAAMPPPPMPQASAMMAAETLPGPMSFASLVAGPPPSATPFAQSHTPAPVATPFAQSHTPAPVATPFGAHGAPTFGAPGLDPSHGAPTFGGPAEPQHAPGATPFGAPTFGGPAEPQHAPGATPFGAPLGGLGAQQGMTIGERIPAARASAQGMTIGEMVAQQRLPIESPAHSAPAAGMAPLSAPHTTSGVGMAPLSAPHTTSGVGMAPLGAPHTTSGVGMAPLSAPHTTSGVGMAPLGAARSAAAGGRSPDAARSPIDAAPESTHDAAPHVDVAPPALVEPPRIGPLATPEMVVADLGLPPPSEQSPPSSDALPPPAPPPPVPAEPEPLPLDKYPLERCAKIAASVARTREKKTEILDAHKLDEARWEPLRTHWLDEIKKETERGKTEKLKAYDGAFVGQLEEERGPIAVEEYARIVIAAERGTTNATLQELGLPEGSMLRIQRVWMAKMGKDPELRRLVQSAVEAASES